MTVRAPTSFSSISPRDAALDLLSYEIAGEKASALGRAGKRVEEALARLAAAGEDASGAREERLSEAADAVYWYFIQRELLGWRRHADVIREYGIPKAVLARLGAR